MDGRVAPPGVRPPLSAQALGTAPKQPWRSWEGPGLWASRVPAQIGQPCMTLLPYTTSWAAAGYVRAPTPDVERSMGRA